MKNRAPEQWGKLQIFTGNGKGKTTAALGTALRAFAVGKRVAIVWFDKGGTHYSERTLLGWLADQQTPMHGALTLVPCGLDRIDPESGRFRFGVTDEDKAEATRGWTEAERFIRSGEHDLIVLDEINSTIALGMLAEAPVLAALDAKPTNVEIICTGRDASEALRERADLVTEMTLVKHYFYKGATAREGLDY